MILGCDAAGLDEDGNEVVVHGVIGDPRWTGDEADDPGRSLLSERHQGTFAEQVVVPRRNLVPKPASLSFEEAACLPTAWLTAYRMLFVQGDLQARRDRARAGRRRRRRHRAHHPRPRRRASRVLATSRDEAKRARARRDRRPRGVRVRRPPAGQGRRGDGDRRQGHLEPLDPLAAPRRPHRHQRHDVGSRRRRRRASPASSSCSSRSSARRWAPARELDPLVKFLDATGARPLIDRAIPMEDARDGFAAMAGGRRLRQDRLHPMTGTQVEARPHRRRLRHRARAGPPAGRARRRPRAGRAQRRAGRGARATRFAARPGAGRRPRRPRHPQRDRPPGRRAGRLPRSTWPASSSSARSTGCGSPTGRSSSRSTSPRRPC